MATGFLLLVVALIRTPVVASELEPMGVWLVLLGLASELRRVLADDAGRCTVQRLCCFSLPHSGPWLLSSAW